ncbi:MAG: hypothetical protein PHD87_01425 [Candidatus Cloacimonetes bacterium]|nr:hypothetical protein [Candidatus Cloacimonadota bacterium]
MKKSVQMLMLAALMLAAACSAPQKAADNGTTDPARPTILVAVLKGADTQHKKALIEMIRTDYSEHYTLSVREVAKPADIEGLGYDALIVMETLKAWLLFNRGLKQFAELPDQSRIVYFVSSGDGKWRWKGRDIRIVTGATTKVRPADSYLRLKEQLDSILSP